jgi:hypothetical protein
VSSCFPPLYSQRGVMLATRKVPLLPLASQRGFNLPCTFLHDLNPPWPRALPKMKTPLPGPRFPGSNPRNPKPETLNPQPPTLNLKVNVAAPLPPQPLPPCTFLRGSSSSSSSTFPRRTKPDPNAASAQRASCYGRRSGRNNSAGYSSYSSFVFPTRSPAPKRSPHPKP